jgi:hypothetical protein
MMAAATFCEIMCSSHLAGFLLCKAWIEDGFYMLILYNMQNAFAF